jgi:hypothetical protein
VVTRTRQNAKEAARIEAERLERVRVLNLARLRRFRERKRVDDAAEREARIYEVEPS